MTRILDGHAEIDSMQFLLQPDHSSDGEVFRPQVTDAREILSIVTTPKPVSLPLSNTGTELTLPMRGSGVDFKHTHLQMIWKASSLYTIFTFIDIARGVTLYQKVDVTPNCRGVSPVMGGLGHYHSSPPSIHRPLPLVYISSFLKSPFYPLPRTLIHPSL